jgi:hypothetical protein
MNKYLRSLVAVVCLGASATVVAQKSAKRTVTHKEVRHKSGNAHVPDDAKKLNTDLTKLEGQSSRSLRARNLPEKNAVPHNKSTVQQDRRGNPPIDFTYRGGAGTHKASRGTGKSAKAGPRLK